MTTIIDIGDYRKISEMLSAIYGLELAIVSTIDLDINFCLAVNWDPRPEIRRIIEVNSQIIDNINEVIKTQYKCPSLSNEDIKMLLDFKIITGTIKGMSHENRPISELVKPVENLKTMIKMIKEHFYQKFIYNA